MTKPDWKDAPEWAQWLAQDGDGKWWWHSRRPAILLAATPQMGIWACNAAFGYAGRSEFVNDWQESLEQRPAVQP